MVVCCCGLSILVSFVVARFTFFPCVVFVGGVIVFLFVVVSIPRLVGFAVAGVRLVLFACGVCCSDLCCSRGGCVGWFVGLVSLQQGFPIGAGKQLKYLPKRSYE